MRQVFKPIYLNQTIEVIVFVVPAYILSYFYRRGIHTYVDIGDIILYKAGGGTV